MNAKQLIASVVLLAATGAVFAQAGDYEAQNAKFVSTKTRAEVIAELKQAKAEGDFVTGGSEFANDVPMMAKNIRGRSEAIESAGSKSATKANGG